VFSYLEVTLFIQDIANQGEAEKCRDMAKVRKIYYMLSFDLKFFY
jgi:hypothetical protein